MNFDQFNIKSIYGQKEVSADAFGAKAKLLRKLYLIGVPIPDGVFIPIKEVSRIAKGKMNQNITSVCGKKKCLFALRSSPKDRNWGGIDAVLNLGMCDAYTRQISSEIGIKRALQLYRRFIQSFSVNIYQLDPEVFENLLYDQMRLLDLDDERFLEEEDLRKIILSFKRVFKDEVGRDFPQSLSEQISLSIKAMAHAWYRESAKILRDVRGAPQDAGMGLILQEMVLGIGYPLSGSGQINTVDPKNGASRLQGYFLPESQGLGALAGDRTPYPLSESSRLQESLCEPTLENLHPSLYLEIESIVQKTIIALGDMFNFEFTIENGRLFILDAIPAERSAIASVKIAVNLHQIGAISKEAALLKVEPHNLVEFLHPRIDQSATKDVFALGLGASPGASSGKIVFSSEAASILQSKGEKAILVRVETSPEDIRGMHASVGVLTVSGGMTSHAAVIARGLGLPCVVGATELNLDLEKKIISTKDGRKFVEGDEITLNGTSGEAISGATTMVQPELSGAFSVLMGWADEIRTIGVRGNADTPLDAKLSKDFGVDGIGLCRTEHMFFEQEKLTVMREMILAKDEITRGKALKKLLPIQRESFVQIFEIMVGLPVTIRLLDPPLHEFLPYSKEDMKLVAESMNVPLVEVIQRSKQLIEFNPMLGKRGVRLGITMPEIYEMQARAIFEAAIIVNKRTKKSVVPEIMIPLVSANREVELIKKRIEDIAYEIEKAERKKLNYKLGVVVETPRAALRAGDIASTCEFLSFGTNDLTQMTYGLSRDDAGRFMRDYIEKRVFVEDPFHSLDLEGVGELILIAARRGRKQNPNLVLGLCGEHGGDPNSIKFCKVAHFDYVSCSPFRVPIARLAAAQASISIC